MEPPSGSQQQPPYRKHKKDDDPSEASATKRPRTDSLSSLEMEALPEDFPAQPIDARKIAGFDHRMQFFLEDYQSFHDLEKLSRNLITNSRVSEQQSEIVPGETGAFSIRPFREGEVIGFYRGQLVRRKDIPPKWLRHLPVRVPKSSEKACIVWHQAGNKMMFRASDTHTAWSGATLFGTGVELGLDGKVEGQFGGSNLRAINHSDTPNVRLITVANEEHLSESEHAFAKLSLKPELVNSHSILIIAIADEDIDPETELTFNYKANQLKHPIDFNVAGKNILPQIANQVQITKHRVHFLKQPMEVDPQEPLNDIAASAEYIEALPEALRDLTYRCIQGEREATSLLREEVCRIQMAPGGQENNPALDAYLLYLMFHNNFDRDTLAVILKAVAQGPLIPMQRALQWTNQEQIYDYLLQRELIQGELLYSLMTQTWLAQHGTPEMVEDYICYLYEEGLLNARIVPNLSRNKVPNPLRDDGSWHEADITAILRKHGHYTESADQLSDQQLKELLSSAREEMHSSFKGDNWRKLITHMREGDSRCICGYIMMLMEMYNTQGQFRKLPENLRNIKVILKIEDNDQPAGLFSSAYYVFLHGTTEQKIKALEWMREYDKSLLDQISLGRAGNCTNFLMEKFKEPTVSYLNHMWPGYTEYLKKEYVVHCIEPNASGKVDKNKARTRLKNIKDNRLFDGCSDWVKADLEEKWQEFSEYLKAYPTPPARMLSS